MVRWVAMLRLCEALKCLSEAVGPAMHGRVAGQCLRNGQGARCARRMRAKSGDPRSASGNWPAAVKCALPRPVPADARSPTLRPRDERTRR